MTPQDAPLESHPFPAVAAALAFPDSQRQPGPSRAPSPVRDAGTAR